MKSQVMNRVDDKVDIFVSHLGMYSTLRDDYFISVLNNDGSLNIPHVHELARSIANAGGNMTRDFYWCKDEDDMIRVSPIYKRVGSAGCQVRGVFLADQLTIAKIFEMYDIGYCWSIFNHCNAKGAVAAFDPFRGYSRSFYGADAKAIRNRYMMQLLNTFQDSDATGGYGNLYLEIVNEIDSSKEGAIMAAESFVYLINHGFPPERIIQPYDGRLKQSGEYVRANMLFRKTVVRALGEKYENILKSRCLTPIHNANVKNLDQYFNHGLKPGEDIPSGGTRRVLVSGDGLREPMRPTNSDWYTVAKTVFAIKGDAAKNNRIAFEVVEKERSNPANAVGGVVRAYVEHFGVKPNNLGEYPESLLKPPPVSPPVEPPAPNRPVTISHEDFDRILEVNLQLGELRRTLTEVLAPYCGGIKK